MLKTILYGFMDSRYASLRELEDRCKVNIRYMYLMDYERPSYRSFSYFINEELTDTVEEIFRAVMEHIRKKDHVDMEHMYIDGTKFEANANKYTWVWKKATEKSRYRLYGKITASLQEIQESLSYTRIVRRRFESVKLEIYLVSLGHNLYKYHNKMMRLRNAA